MDPRDDPERLRLLALLAFVGHYPAVRLVGGRRMRPEWVRKNLVAIGATVAAVGVASVVGARSGHAGVAAFAAFSAGHLAWSSWLAWGIVKGVALRPRDATV